MFVIVDVLFAVAVIAFTAGAIPKFQIRVADVCAATDGAPMVVGSLGGVPGSCLVEMDHLCLLFLCFAACFYPQ